MPGQVEYPRNELTEMIERVAQGNRSGVHGGVPTSAEPRPSVQSAAVGREVVPPVEEPMTLEERMELDRLAREAGVQDDRIGSTPAPGGYATFEEAMAAGAPVNPPAIPPPVSPQQRTGHRETLVRTVERNQSPPPPRLPNFKNVQGIDLISGVVYVDDMEFPIPELDLSDFRRYAVEVARADIMKKLEEAVGLFTQSESAEAPDEETVHTPESTDASLQPEPTGSSPEPPV